MRDSGKIQGVVQFHAERATLKVFGGQGQAASTPGELAELRTSREAALNSKTLEEVPLLRFDIHYAEMSVPRSILPEVVSWCSYCEAMSKFPENIEPSSKSILV